MPKITVERLVAGELAVNCYIVENTETRECFLVDPGAEAQRIIRQVGDRKACAVLLTHGHYDHIGALDEVCGHFGIPAYIHAGDAAKLNDAMANVSAVFGQPLVQQTVPQIIEQEGELTLAGMKLQILHTPGHSNGCICCILPDHQGILTGDTLFAHGYGRTDFADGDFGRLVQSLRRLYRLTPKMIAYPGHDVPGETGHDPVGE
ncbi:MAG: MBL fold metallo-hydrolase [Clostridia bacterium]|nr:MBL fold metallo-hydrolase [Clostridia bacterium]